MQSSAVKSAPAAVAPPVIACLDRSRHATDVLAHALAMAAMLDVPLNVVQALEPPTGAEDRPDPLDWAIRRLEARETLNRLVVDVAGPERAARTAVALLHGRVADQIRHECRRRQAALVVIGMHGENGVGPTGGPGSTARDLLEQSTGMVLVVPEGASPQPPRCRRILVPMDGSSWSETALPVAQRLARATGATIALVQVIAAPDPAGTLPPEREDIDLRARLVERDDEVAAAHLDMLQRTLLDQGVDARAFTLRGDDARTALLALLAREPFDLVVMAACGHGAARLPRRGCGRVAAHLAGHSPAPLLIVRQAMHHAGRQADTMAESAPREVAMPPAAARPTADATGHGW